MMMPEAGKAVAEKLARFKTKLLHASRQLKDYLETVRWGSGGWGWG